MSPNKWGPRVWCFLHTLAEKIKDEVKEKVTFPGTVKVTVIREIRAQSEAK